MMVLEKDMIKECCFNTIKNEWLTSNDSFPSFLTKIEKETQTKNEQSIQACLDDFKKQLHSFSHSPFSKLPIGRKKWKKKTFHMVNTLLSTETILGIHNFMTSETLDELQNELKEFLRHVRQFSPELPIEGIGQAIRNYMVYMMFNELNNQDHSFNMACFGYSMLYPFTDNYIDSNEYSDEEKKAYNQIIRDKIEGKEPTPDLLHHKKTCNLLQAIEDNYHNERNSEISQLLLMMLDAQEYSLRQQDMKQHLTDEERLHISLYKGGMSVLIDRFFVYKELTEADLRFYLEFGFFLQLADDLQDIKEDSLHGNQTILTANLQPEYLEKTVNKLLHFIHDIINSYQADNEHFKEFILINCYQLIFSAAAGSREFFSEEYLARLEQCLLVSCSFLETMQQNESLDMDKKMPVDYMKILDEMIS